MHAAILARAQVESVDEVLATVDAVAKRLDTPIQLVDADAVYSRRHVDSAVLHAERAWAAGRLLAKTLAATILLYATGELQVSRAIDRAGIRPGLTRVVVIAVGPRAGAAIWGALDKLGWSRDPAGIAPNAAALERLGFAPGPDGEAEMRVLERVALVDVRK